MDPSANCSSPTMIVSPLLSHASSSLKNRRQSANAPPTSRVHLSPARRPRSAAEVPLTSHVTWNAESRLPSPEKGVSEKISSPAIIGSPVTGRELPSQMNCPPTPEMSAEGHSPRPIVPEWTLGPESSRQSRSVDSDAGLVSLGDEPAPFSPRALRTETNKPHATRGSLYNINIDAAEAYDLHDLPEASAGTDPGSDVGNYTDNGPEGESRKRHPPSVNASVLGAAVTDIVTSPCRYSRLLIPWHSQIFLLLLVTALILFKLPARQPCLFTSGVLALLAALYYYCSD